METTGRRRLEWNKTNTHTGLESSHKFNQYILIAPGPTASSFPAFFEVYTEKHGSTNIYKQVKRNIFSWSCSPVWKLTKSPCVPTFFFLFYRINYKTTDLSWELFKHVLCLVSRLSAVTDQVTVAVQQASLNCFHFKCHWTVSVCLHVRLVILMQSETIVLICWGPRLSVVSQDVIYGICLRISHMDALAPAQYTRFF